MKKKRQSKLFKVELRADGYLHGSEKPGWSAGDMVKWPGNRYTTSKIKNYKTKTS